MVKVREYAQNLCLFVLCVCLLVCLLLFLGGGGEGAKRREKTHSPQYCAETEHAKIATTPGPIKLMDVAHRRHMIHSSLLDITQQDHHSPPSSSMGNKNQRKRRRGHFIKTPLTNLESGASVK